MEAQACAAKKRKVFPSKRWEWVGTERLSFLGINKLNTEAVPWKQAMEQLLSSWGSEKPSAACRMGLSREIPPSVYHNQTDLQEWLDWMSGPTFALVIQGFCRFQHVKLNVFLRPLWMLTTDFSRKDVKENVLILLLKQEIFSNQILFNMHMHEINSAASLHEYTTCCPSTSKFNCPHRAQWNISSNCFSSLMNRTKRAKFNV